MTIGELTDRFPNPTTTDESAFACSECGTTFVAGAESGPPVCPDCESTDAAHRDPADGRREITAPWWTFVGASLVFIVATTATLYAGLLAYHVLLG